MRIASTIGTTTVNHDGVTYTADEQGIFDVPEPVGLELTAFPTWEPEHVAAARAAAEQAAHDTDAVVQARRIAALEGELAEVRETVAGLADALAGLLDPPTPKRTRKTADE